MIACTSDQQSELEDQDVDLRIRKSPVGIGKTNLFAQMAISTGTSIATYFHQISQQRPQLIHRWVIPCHVPVTALGAQTKRFKMDSRICFAATAITNSGLLDFLTRRPVAPLHITQQFHKKRMLAKG
jgi:hypothetical protein